MLPPNWKEVIEHSSEMATTEDVFKVDTWLSDQQMVDATDQLIDPFAIVPDQHKKKQPQRHAANESTPITEHAVSEVDRSPHSLPPPHCDLKSHAAANLFDINACANIGRAEAAINNGRSNQIADLGVQINIFATLERLNPHDNGLRWSLCLRE